MTNKFNDSHLESLDKRLRELRKEVEGDLERYSCNYPDENRLINDVEYCRQWIKDNVELDSTWFMEEIYK